MMCRWGEGGLLGHCNECSEWRVNRIGITTERNIHTHPPTLYTGNDIHDVL